MSSFLPPLPKTCGNWRSLSAPGARIRYMRRRGSTSPRPQLAPSHIAVFKVPGSARYPSTPSHGKFVQVGAPLEVYRNPANTFVASFLATPPMNLLPAKFEEEDGGGLALVHAALRLPVAEAYWAAYALYRERPAILGIRPEDMYASAVPGGVAVDLRVGAVEALGPETILVTEFPGGEVSSRLDPRLRRPGRIASAPFMSWRSRCNCSTRKPRWAFRAHGPTCSRSSISAAPTVAGRHLGRLSVWSRPLGHPYRLI
jgi:hypothetical protein